MQPAQSGDVRKRDAQAPPVLLQEAGARVAEEGQGGGKK